MIGRRGFSLLEFLVVMGVFVLFLIPTVAVFQRYRRSLVLEEAVREVESLLQCARDHAENERREYRVVFSEETAEILRDDGLRIGREYRLPEHVFVAATTYEGGPVVFRADGSAAEAGSLYLRERRSRREKRIVVYNLTGRAAVR